MYPGPQTESVTKVFSPKSQNVALAQFGFIVIEVGNRGGNPNRSKWYHTYGYGNLRDYGLADKKAAIEQLARRYPFIDLDRVGITGHSGGGFMSTAAMLVYPDFFKVAVSESGNHENNVYNNTWSEKHQGIRQVGSEDGPPEDVKFEYAIEKNSDLAKNLKGHLLLTTGDIDDNVHPANTLRMANALIKAHKRFDFFVLPASATAIRRRPITSSGSARTISAAGCSESRPTASTSSSSIGKRNKQERRGADGERQALYRPLPQPPAVGSMEVTSTLARSPVRISARSALRLWFVS